MADNQDTNERTEQPTERRKSESRKKGQVARSRELNTMLSLLFASAGLLTLGGNTATQFMALFEAELSFGPEVIFDTASLAPRFVHFMVSSLMLLVPFFSVMVLGAFVGPLVMGGWFFTPSAMAFKLEKLDPIKGLKRLVSAKGLLELIKALFKFFTLLTTAVFLFKLFIDQILFLGSYPPQQAVNEALGLLMWSLLALSFTMICIVIFDVPFELWNHNKQLKMTLQEVKDEMKETDGRPEVKGRIRNLQREISQRRMMADVPTADVIITNPTHFSVALRYADNSSGAPTVIAKGRDLMAFKIRSVATENDVAIFSAPPLARALYSSTEIGQEIPQNLYLAVAKVLAYIYQLRAATSSEYIAPPNDLFVPEQ